MRRLTLMIAAAMFFAACGGSDSDASGDADNGADAPDACTLADETILAEYFGESVVEPERTEAGPIMGCRWRDAGANSVLIQVAADFPLFRPDPCDGCSDVAFGDEGYATESPLQSSATVVSGNLWLSVTTTGFGDDLASITELLEDVFEIASR